MKHVYFIPKSCQKFTVATPQNELICSETSKGALPTYMKIAQSELFLQYTTKEVELIQEEPRQSLSEYIAMIGGNIGLWNGASIISIGHLIFLIFKAAGIEPFGL